MVLGLIASYMAVATTMVSVVLLGWILLGASAGLVVLSFLTGDWSGFLLTLAAGVLSVINGDLDSELSRFRRSCGDHGDRNIAYHSRHLSVGGIDCHAVSQLGLVTCKWNC